MTPVLCLGSNDCYRACVASILNLPADAVPNVHGDDSEGGVHDQTSQMRRWLTEAFGLTIFQTYCSGGWAIEDLLRVYGGMNPGVPMILSGLCGNRGHHAVVIMNGAIAHDPSGAGLTGPCSDGYWWLDIVVAAETWKAVA